MTLRPWVAYTHRVNTAATIVTSGDYVISAVSMSAGATPFTVQFEVWDIWNQFQVDKRCIALDQLYGSTLTQNSNNSHTSSLSLWQATPGALLTWHNHGFILRLDASGHLTVATSLGFVGNVLLCFFDDEVILCGQRYLEPMRRAIGSLEESPKQASERKKLPKSAGNVVRVDARDNLYVCTDRGQVLAYTFNTHSAKKTLILNRATVTICDPMQEKRACKYIPLCLSFPYVCGREVTKQSIRHSLSRSRARPGTTAGFLYQFSTMQGADKACMLHGQSVHSPVHCVAEYRGFVVFAMEKDLAVMHNNRIIVSVEVPGIKNGFVLARNFAIVLPDLWVDIDALVSAFGFNLNQGRVLARGDHVCYIDETRLMLEDKNETKMLFESVNHFLDVAPPRFLLARDESTVLFNSESKAITDFPLAYSGFILGEDIVVVSPLCRDLSDRQALYLYNEPTKNLTKKDLNVEVVSLIRDQQRESVLACSRTHLMRLRWDSDECVQTLWRYPTENCVVAHVWNDQTLILGFPRVLCVLRESTDRFDLLFSYDVTRCYSLAIGMGKVFVATAKSILEVPSTTKHATAPPFPLEKPMAILAIQADRMILMEEAYSSFNEDGSLCAKRRIRYKPLTPCDEKFIDSRTVWPNSNQPWILFACLHAPPQLRNWAHAAERDGDIFRAVALRTLGLSVGERRRLSLSQLQQTRNSLEENLRRMVLEDRRDDIRAIVAYTRNSAAMQEASDENPNALKLVFEILRGFLLIMECSEFFEWTVQPPCSQLLDAFAQNFYFDDQPLHSDALCLTTLDHWHGFASQRPCMMSPRGATGVFRRSSGHQVSELIAAPRLCEKDNLVIYWRCVEKHGDICGDSAGLGRYGDIEYGIWGEELSILEAEDDWGVKKKPNCAVVLPHVDSCIVYGGDDCTDMEEWTIEFHIRSSEVSHYLLRMGDIWIRRESNTMVGSFGTFATLGNGIDFSEWTYVAIRHKNRAVEIVTQEGLEYSYDDAARCTIPPNVPLRFGGQCQITEIRMWNIWREMDALMDFYQRPLLQISESQNKTPNWKNIRFLGDSERKSVAKSAAPSVLLIAPPPREQPSTTTSVQLHRCPSLVSPTLSSSGAYPMESLHFPVTRYPETEPAAAPIDLRVPPFEEGSPVANTTGGSPAVDDEPASSQQAAPVQISAHVEKGPPLNALYSPVAGPPVYAPVARTSPPGSPMRQSRGRRKSKKNPFMPQIIEEDESAPRAIARCATRRDSVSSMSDEPTVEEELVNPVMHEAFCEMIGGRFDRAELLLGAIDIRGRWVYQVCLKLLRRQHEAGLIEKTQISCMLLRLPVLRKHRTTLRKRAMGYFALANATKCALHVAQVLMIENGGEEEIRNAYRALKAKGGPVPNIAVCGICPNCEQHMPLHPFETRCRICGIDTAFDSKQMRLINKKNSHRCGRCGFVELRPKTNECSFCGTHAAAVEPVINWY